MKSQAPRRSTGRTDTLSRLLGLALAVLMSTAATPTLAADPPLHVDDSVDDCSMRLDPTLEQDDFHRFVEEFGTISAFRQVGSANVIGQGRASIGIELLRFTIDENAPAWNDTFVHPDADHDLGATHRFPKLKLATGLLADLDLGASYSRNPDANYGWLGLDAKYRALSEDQGAVVDLAFRSAYTKTLYVADMSMHALTLDLSLGKGLGGGLRPYVGLGADQVIARETTNAVDLHAEHILVPHYFGGLAVTIMDHVELGAEVVSSAVMTQHLQIALSF